MLRISTHEEPDCLTFRLEGRLAGSWVQEMEDCWRSKVVNQPISNIRLDLTGVTYIDQPGKSFLKVAHSQGVKFIACGCLMRAIVAELINSRQGDVSCPDLTSVSPDGGAT